MTQSNTQQGIQPIEAEILEADSNLESNSSSKPSNFPCSKLEASKHLPISDVTVGKYLTALTEAGVRSQGSKVTATDFHHLTQMCDYKDRGDSVADYVALLQPAQESEPFRDTPRANGLAIRTEQYESRANLALSRQANGQAKALALIDSIKKSQGLTRTRRNTGRETARANAMNDAVQDAEVYIETYSQTHNTILDAFHGVEGES